MGALVLILIFYLQLAGFICYSFYQLLHSAKYVFDGHNRDVKSYLADIFFYGILILFVPFVSCYRSMELSWGKITLVLIFTLCNLTTWITVMAYNNDSLLSYITMIYGGVVFIAMLGFWIRLAFSNDLS